MIFLVTHNPKISYSELARITGKSIATIKRLISKLKKRWLNQTKRFSQRRGTDFNKGLK